MSLLFKACMAYGNQEISTKAFHAMLIHHGYWGVALNQGLFKNFVLLCVGA